MTLSNQRPLRILQVVGGMNRGGIETWLINVLRHIDRDRFQIDFLVHTTQPCAYDDEIRALGSRIIPCLHSNQPWLYARNFKQILRDYGPYDVVHAQLYLFSGLVLYIAHQEKVCTRIAHMHPLTDLHEKRFLRAIYQKIMTRLLSKYATHIIAPSKSSLKAFQAICNCSGKHNEILYNGIELSQFDREVDKRAVRQKFNLPVDKPIVIYVARFTAHKNHAQILRIADRMSKNGVNVYFVMVGSHGELLNTLKEKVSERNDMAMMVGVEDISELLKTADLFFLPSLEEGFGVVAIEAAAAGLPVVATDLPTIREACSPSHHPFMFPPNNDELACKNILSILENQELRKQLSADARKWATNFSIFSSIKQLVHLYENCTQ